MIMIFDCHRDLFEFAVKNPYDASVSTTGALPVLRLAVTRDPRRIFGRARRKVLRIASEFEMY